MMTSWAQMEFWKTCSTSTPFRPAPLFRRLWQLINCNTYKYIRIEWTVAFRQWRWNWKFFFCKVPLNNLVCGGQNFASFKSNIFRKQNQSHFSFPRKLNCFSTMQTIKIQRLQKFKTGFCSFQWKCNPIRPRQKRTNKSFQNKFFFSTFFNVAFEHLKQVLCSLLPLFTVTLPPWKGNVQAFKKQNRQSMMIFQWESLWRSFSEIGVEWSISEESDFKKCHLQFCKYVSNRSWVR